MKWTHFYTYSKNELNADTLNTWYSVECTVSVNTCLRICMCNPVPFPLPVCLKCIIYLVSASLSVFVISLYLKHVCALNWHKMFEMIPNYSHLIKRLCEDAILENEFRTESISKHSIEHDWSLKSSLTYYYRFCAYLFVSCKFKMINIRLIVVKTTMSISSK